MIVDKEPEAQEKTDNIDHLIKTSYASGGLCQEGRKEPWTVTHLRDEGIRLFSETGC